MSRILVTDGEQRSSLAVVRSLGRAGHDVVVASSVERPLAGASRFAASAHVVPDPRKRAERYREAVDRLLSRERIDVLIPMTDVSATLLLELRTTRPHVVIPFPSQGAYERISDKRALLEVASTLGIPVPEQVVIEGPDADLSEANAWARERSFDVAIKPVRSVVVEEGSITRHGVAVVGDEPSFEAALASYSSSQAFPLLVQRRIHGPGLGAFFLAQEGAPIAHFAHRRLREKPPTGGVSVYRESVELRPDLRRHAEAVLSAFDWTGVAMVEFKEDRASGVPYLMEVNGRFWGSLQLAIDAGVDFPRLLMACASGTPVDAVEDYTRGVRSRWLWGDFDHLLWILRAGAEARDRHPDLGTRSAAIARFLLPWRPGDRFEVLRVGDPGPFVRESLNWVRSLRAEE